MFGFGKKNKLEVVPEDENATPTPYETTQLGQARHKVESELLVDHFMMNPTAVIGYITEEYGLSAMFGELYRLLKIRKQPYYADEYALDMKKTEFEDYLIITELPKPPHTGLCYRMYYLFDAPFEHIALITVERAEEGADIYMWDRDKNRTLIGSVEIGPWKEKSKEERDAELQMISDVFHEGMEPPAPKEEPEDKKPADDTPAEEAEIIDGEEAE